MPNSVLTDERTEAPRGARLPGDPNMWMFVLGDLVFFSCYFVFFMLYRTRYPDLFLSSQQHLGVNTAMVNTLVLLASSRFIALAVQATRAADPRRALRLVQYGAACGVVFIAIKVFEWVSEIDHGYTISTNSFWMFYFMITGVHLFHVAFGLVVLGVISLDLRTPELRRPAVVEAGATYWHMVDLLWVVIFALIYVMR